MKLNDGTEMPVLALGTWLGSGGKVCLVVICFKVFKNRYDF